MPKFFVPEAAPGARFLVLTGENAAHAKVLRLKPGERVTICDAKGTDFQCTVSDVAPGQISLVVQCEEPSRAEPAVFCSVYMTNRTVWFRRTAGRPSCLCPARPAS